MKESPTNIIFIWHMHQPIYRLPEENEFRLPWVRLHAVKDYYGMAKVIEKTKAKAVINFSGILLKQLQEYVNGAEDKYGKLSLKDPEKMSTKEKKFVTLRFFSVNFDRIIQPHRRYYYLYDKAINRKEVLDNQELRDLQVLFNLNWFHPYTLAEDSYLVKLKEKKENYQKEDIAYIIHRHYEIIKEIFPLYKKLIKNKQIELSFTPYAHPIMPLICNSDIIDKFPYLKKPRYLYHFPHDCHLHIQRSKQLIKEVLGYNCLGSWPSEGAVSEDIVPIYQKEKVRWIGTDEDILFYSLASEFLPYQKAKEQHHLLYQPHQYNNLIFFFRDRGLSDAISFIYHGWDNPYSAAKDFLENCRNIHYRYKEQLKQRVITIIMDGENAWEYYPNNAVEFLETVYNSIKDSQELDFALPSQLIVNNHDFTPLHKLHPGSWINADFRVWIGESANNSNWERLAKLRQQIAKIKSSAKRKKLMEYIYLMEGSDWNWWNTFYEPTGEFKELFLDLAKAVKKEINAANRKKKS